MTVDMERYTELLEQFRGISESHIDSEVLNRLKVEYKDIIDSRRVLETITDINSLLKVLEKRGVLQYDEIKVLKDIATQYVKDQSVQKALLDYEQWLAENSSKIDNLYNCGKSSNLSNISEPNRFIAPEVVYSSGIHRNMHNHESEEPCSERLLLNTSHITLHQPQITNNRNNFSTIVVKRCPKKYRKKKHIIVLVLTIICLIILICVIWILVKISYHSTAIVSKENSVTEASTGQSTMSYFASNFNMGVSQATQSAFTLNHSQYYSSGTTVPPIDRDKELQQLIINRICRKIGSYWRDVARRLDIEEAFIDDTENQYLHAEYPSEKMFKKVLNLYFSEHHSDWKIQLMRALESSRRKDLKEIVFEMLYQNNS